MTEHAFNPAVAPLVDLYRSCRDAGKLPDAHSLAEAQALSRPEGVTMTGKGISLERSGMRLTFDGIAKGYITDKASDILLQKGLPHHLINSGGDIRVSGYSEKKTPMGCSH